MERTYRNFADFRRELRGSSSWSCHVDEIADQVGHVDEKQVKPHAHALFDSFEDFESDDE